MRIRKRPQATKLLTLAVNNRDAVALCIGRYWYKADIPKPAINVRYWSKSGHRSETLQALAGIRVRVRAANVARRAKGAIVKSARP